MPAPRPVGTLTPPCGSCSSRQVKQDRPNAGRCLGSEGRIGVSVTPRRSPFSQPIATNANNLARISHQPQPNAPAPARKGFRGRFVGGPAAPSADGTRQRPSGGRGGGNNEGTSTARQPRAVVPDTPLPLRAGSARQSGPSGAGSAQAGVGSGAGSGCGGGTCGDGAASSAATARANRS